MAVHDSKESWEQFRDQILMPRMKQGIEGGLIGPPQETAFEVHNLQTGDQLTYTVPAFSGGGTAVATWKRATSRKHRAAGSVVDFVAEETAPAEESVGLGSDELHQQYVRWCREKGSEGLPREAFVEEFDRLRELS